MPEHHEGASPKSLLETKLLNELIDKMRDCVAGLQTDYPIGSDGQKGFCNAVNQMRRALDWIEKQFNERASKGEIRGVVLRKGVDGIARVFIESAKGETEIISSYAEGCIIDHWVNWDTVQKLLSDVEGQ